jgi:hypothetical protein
MIRPGELDAVLGHLPFDDVSTRRGVGGIVVRFNATAIPNSTASETDSAGSHTAG